MSAVAVIRAAFSSRSGVDSSRAVRNALLGVLVGFGCGVISARMLGPHDRGALALLVTTVGLCGFVSGLGTSASLRVGLMRDPRVQIRAYVELSICLAVLQALVVLGAVLALGQLVGLDQYRVTSLLIAEVLLGISCFAAQQVLDAVSAVGWPSTAAFLNSLGSLATLVVLSIAWALEMDLLAAIVAYAIGFGVVAVVGGLVCARRARQVPPADPAIRSHLRLVKRGIPLLGLYLGQSLAFKLDQYFVGAFAGVAATGTYSVAAAHVAPSQVASNSVGQVAFRDAAQDDLADRKVLWMVFVAVLMAAGCATALWLAAPWFIPTVFGSGFEGAVPIVRVLMIGQLLLAPYLVLSRAYAGRGSVLLSSGSSVLLLVLLLASLMALTPSFGPLGAAWASVIAFGVVSLILLLALRTKSHPRYLSATD